MANYLMTHNRGEIKNKYRLEAHMDERTHDFPRSEDGTIDPSFNDIYIACQYGNEIYHYGRSILEAYIPSIGRGNNILKSIEEQGIPVTNVQKGDNEVLFRFHVSQLDKIAALMKAKTVGKGSSPFSISRYPKNPDIQIPSEQIEVYKAITASVTETQPLLLGRWLEEFLYGFLAKKAKEIPNKNVEADMKQMKLYRQKKEYIWAKGYWNEYLEFLKEKAKEW